ncbi:MAG TPA: hypothetical protein VNW71_23140 [Thermoanaerobaculia bacterium]|nr:hypothetical protein [Thermoanaerobaculia bacterium]
MVTEFPPPPAPLVERLEASFPSPYEYLWASEGETPSEAVPVEPEGPVRLAFGESALAHPIKLLLDRLGFSLRPLFGEIQDDDVSPMPVTEHNGLGDGSPGPVPPGDPIPVGGGGGPNGG